MSEPFKSELRLVIQASVPVEEIIEGDELYRQLKEMLKNYSPNVTLNGQIIKLLEPCCKDKSKIPAAVGFPITKGYANVNNTKIP